MSGAIDRGQDFSNDRTQRAGLGRVLPDDSDRGGIGAHTTPHPWHRAAVSVGAGNHSSDMLDSAGRHRWCPIAPCARVEVAMDRPALSWSGPAYFDTNNGDRPLEADFIRWDWSRMRLPGGTGILYDVRAAGRAPGTGNALR